MSSKVKSMIEIVNIIMKQHERIVGYSSLSELTPDQKELMAFRLMDFLEFEKIKKPDFHLPLNGLTKRDMKAFHED